MASRGELAAGADGQPGRMAAWANGQPGPTGAPGATGAPGPTGVPGPGDVVDGYLRITGTPSASGTVRGYRHGDVHGRSPSGRRWLALRQQYRRRPGDPGKLRLERHGLDGHRRADLQVGGVLGGSIRGLRDRNPVVSSRPR